MHRSSGEASVATVLVALASNLVIAVAKIFAGLVGASSALLSEGAHSVADTFNELLLLAAIQRSGRPADSDHPFGYGRERFFYSLLAGFGIFVAGGVFSIAEGIRALGAPAGTTGDYVLKYAILGGSFLLEGVSWLRAVHQIREESRSEGHSMAEHLAGSSDPTVKTVFSEDSAALVGLLLAFLGVALHQATGQPAFDAIASIGIGVLLVAVAVVLIRDNRDYLIGQSARPEVRAGIRSMLEDHPEVTSVVELITEVMGPAELLVAARIDLDDELTGAQVEELSDGIDTEIRQAFPTVTQVFLDATRTGARQREERRGGDAGKRD